jgi:hypothetical protein
MIVGSIFYVFVVVALLNVCGEIYMRVCLSRRETSRDKLTWWRRGGDEVSESYEGVFSRSFIPKLRRYTFWGFIAFCASILVGLLWKSK